MGTTKMLRVSDIQKHLGVSKNRAYDIIHMKTFPKIQIGHRFYIPEDKYQEWLDINTRSTILL